MSEFADWLLYLVKVTALVCVSILCVAMLCRFLLWIIPRRLLLYVLYSLHLEDFAKWNFGRDSEIRQQEYLDIESDHEAVQLWVIDSMGFNSTSELPSSMIEIFPRLFYSSRRLVAYNDNPLSAVATGQRKPSAQERALLQLSSILTSQRMALRSKVQSAYFFWQCTSLIAIALGMVTTILVSVSSTEFGRGDGWNQQLIRLFAIIFPALGTAVAAVIAFYSPQAAWSQASRTLASLTQLHGQIALELWTIKGSTSENAEYEKQLATALEDWSKRYTDIQTVSSAAGGTTGSGVDNRGPTGGVPSSSQGGGQGSKPTEK